MLFCISIFNLIQSHTGTIFRDKHSFIPRFIYIITCMQLKMYNVSKSIKYHHEIRFTQTFFLKWVNFRAIYLYIFYCHTTMCSARLFIQHIHKTKIIIFIITHVFAMTKLLCFLFFLPFCFKRK